MLCEEENHAILIRERLNLRCYHLLTVRWNMFYGGWNVYCKKRIK